MIQHIRVLKTSLADKDIYIWDVGKYAMWVFYGAAMRRVNIRGFVTNYPQYVGDTIMNRPIISPEEFREKKNAVILVSEKVTKGTFDLVKSYGQECYLWPDALELNPGLKQGSHFLYDTDNDSWNFIKEAEHRGVKIRGFLKEGAAEGEKILGLPVKDPFRAGLKNSGSVIILKHQPQSDGIVTDRLQQNGFTGTIFLNSFSEIQNIWSVDCFAMLDSAVKQKKRILLCCEDAMGRALLHEVLSTYGIPIAREVCYGGSPENGLDDIWSLAEEDPAESVLMIHSFSRKRRYEIIEAANDLGYHLEDHNYSALTQYCYNRLKHTDVLVNEYDKKLEYSIDYTAIGGLPGWAVYGDPASADKKIMVLGGSTSSEIYYPECWVSKLYKKIRSEGKNAAIYNGAHEGNAVFHELNRLIRDIHTLKPDIVISMSGFNDLPKGSGKFETVRQENSFEYWRRLESYMKLIAEAEGAKLYAVLQPINQSPEDNTVYEAMMYLGQVHRRGRVFTENRRNDDFYHDLFTRFLHQHEKYIDLCHYSEIGTRELADEVYQMIKDDL